MTPRAGASRATSLARRQRAGRFNRRLGYLTLPLILASSALYYLPWTDLRGLIDALAWIYLPMFFVHVVLSFYVFGLVRPRRTLRVFHIYFGYVTFFVVFASQMSISAGGLRHALLTALMYLAIAVHIAIGLRYTLVRSRTEVPRRGFAIPSGNNGATPH